MELFEDRSVRPMLLTERHEPIESDEWLNELKLDGIRCVAYLRPGETDLRNKRNLRLCPVFQSLRACMRQSLERASWMANSSSRTRTASRILKLCRRAV